MWALAERMVEPNARSLVFALSPAEERQSSGRRAERYGPRTAF